MIRRCDHLPLPADGSIRTMDRGSIGFYCCIATVKPDGQAWQTTLFTRHGPLVAPAASREQGKRWLSRWVAANGAPRRR